MLYRIVREKITHMHGRFLQKITSVEAMRLADQNLICVTQSEGRKKKDGERPSHKTYYKIVDERQALVKVKQIEYTTAKLKENGAFQSNCNCSACSWGLHSVSSSSSYIEQSEL